MFNRQSVTFAVVFAIAVHALVARPAGGDADAVSPRAPERLSETGLYADIATRRVAAGNMPFEPQYPLWTDGAAKTRWISLPANARIDARDVDHWVFPVGTRLWKEFAFEGRKVETRMLWRATPAQWVFASYVWNEEQTEAYLAPAAGIRNHYALSASAKYSIPAEAECRACHESGGTPVLGFNALQLSDDRDPLAPHARPLAEGAVTLRTLDRLRLLEPRRADLVAHPPRIRARSPRERAALGYLSANCGSCHNDSGPLEGLGLHLRHRESSAISGSEPGYATTVNVAGDYVTPGVEAASSRRIVPGSAGASAIVYRMSSRSPSSQMPPLGTAVVDREALVLIRGWIEEELELLVTPRDPLMVRAGDLPVPR